jgi:membrane-bound lytic murein transglycosylase B
MNWKNVTTRYGRFFAVFLFALNLMSCSAVKPVPNMDGFIASMVATHQFDEQELKTLFAAVSIKDDILKKMAKPAEGLPWYQYRKIFMTEARIKGGITFWQENAQTLAEVEHRYGVPATIIIAILGVETQYGQHIGKYRVIDALSTLAFAYPPRSEFFLSELEQFLLLCREEHINPLDPIGSYAGAMGPPQFMPSSFRRFAVDFDQNGHRDIWHNNADIIASVANYFVQHQWQTGQAIAAPITATDDQYKSILNSNLKPNLRITALESLNLKLSGSLALVDNVKILELKQEQGEELWAVSDNFYCLTRYNHSPLYAMAVFQLSQSILNQQGPFP